MADSALLLLLWQRNALAQHRAHLAFLQAEGPAQLPCFHFNTWQLIPMCAGVARRAAHGRLLFVSIRQPVSVSRVCHLCVWLVKCWCATWPGRGGVLLCILLGCLHLELLQHRSMQLCRPAHVEDWAGNLIPLCNQHAAYDCTVLAYWRCDC